MTESVKEIKYYYQFFIKRDSESEFKSIDAFLKSRKINVSILDSSIARIYRISAEEVLKLDNEKFYHIKSDTKRHLLIPFTSLVPLVDGDPKWVQLKN
jgi:hypothetical protein